MTDTNDEPRQVRATSAESVFGVGPLFGEVSRRDFFVGCALMGLLANSKGDDTFSGFAESATDAADATIERIEKEDAARDERGGKPVAGPL